MIATEQWEREAIKTKLLNLGKIPQIAQLNPLDRKSVV